MRSHGQFSWTPHQYHARHPHQCFVCQRTFIKGSAHIHEETSARTCSPLCFTRYERWWLRKRPHVEPPAFLPLNPAPRLLTILSMSSELHSDPPMRVWKAPSPSNRPWNCNSKRIVNVIILEGQDKKCPNLGGVSRIIRKHRYDIEYYFEWLLSRQVCYSETAFKTQR